MTTASARTPWGYEISLRDGSTALPPLMSVDELQTALGRSYTTNKVSWALAAVSAAIRDWCGWHVFPRASCEVVGTGDGRLMMLPAIGDVEVDSVSVSGETLDPSSYEWDGRGAVRLMHGAFPDRWRSVDVAYVAGLDSAVAIQATVVNTAANYLAMTPGVRSETLGDQSVQYMGAGVYLTEQDKSALARYKLWEA